MRQDFDSRTKNQSYGDCAIFRENRRDNCRHSDIGGIHLAVREEGHRTLMIRLVRVCVKEFVERRPRGHRIQQEDNGNQQAAAKRLEPLRKRCF